MGVSAAAPSALLSSFRCLPSRTTSSAKCWREPGRQQYGLMEVEFVSGTAEAGTWWPEFSGAEEHLSGRWAGLKDEAGGAEAALSRSPKGRGT